MLSEGALQQTVAPAASGTHLLGAEPLHHVAGVPAVPAAEAEVGGAAHGHVADGTLEGEALADRTLGAPGLAATVTAVHTKLNAFVWLWWAGYKLEHLRPFLL